MDILTDDRTSSSSPSTRQWEFDVFLSFRGEETRHGFVSHLHKALHDGGIYTFVDNDLLPRGENISAELLKVIDLSKVSIIVFSENYASSTWCLDELIKIFECEKNGQLVLPVFFRVNPLDIEEKFERDLAKHEAELDDVEMVQRWRAALTKAVKFPGSLYNDGYVVIYLFEN